MSTVQEEITCSTCKGKGTVWPKPKYRGQPRQEYTCSKCKGVGRIFKNGKPAIIPVESKGGCCIIC